MPFGTSAMKYRWARVGLEDDSFLFYDKVVNPDSFWQDFVHEGKFKWLILGSFINLKFDNESFKSLQLCLYAPKLDKNETA